MSFCSITNKEQVNKNLLIRNLNLAGFEAVRAQQYLFETRHGVFSTWYENAVPLDKLTKSLTVLREESLERN